jgi:sulfatase modifying factor 1
MAKAITFVHMSRISLLALLCVTCLWAHAQLPLKMVHVDGGEFRMGDVAGTGLREENPVRTVRIAPFLMQQTEVTFAQYDLFCDEAWYMRPEDYNWGRGDSLPVIGVSWYDAIIFCNWLSTREGLKPCYEIDKLKMDSRNLALMDVDKWTVTCNWDANGYRLPTEAEWEYAARGGGRPTDPGAGGYITDSLAWYARNAEFRIRKVAHKQPNPLGIYDLSGNVAEWCWDWYTPVYDIAQTNNPTGADNGRVRIIRGGSWMDEPYALRISYRTGRTPVERNMRHVGFRVVRRP